MVYQVDEYIRHPNANPIAREFLEHARRPSVLKDHDWLREHKPSVSWHGVRYLCVGASALEVLLKKANVTCGSLYDYRVDIEELSDWARP